MAFAPDLTVLTEVYSLTETRAKSSLRSDATMALDEPNHLTIAHEVGRNGRVSSVIYFDSLKALGCGDVCSTTPTTDTIRAQFKVQYNPTVGREDTTTELDFVIQALIAFISEPTNIVKLVNQEH